MSGGSMDYAYYKINEAADSIQHTLADYEIKKKHGVKADKPCQSDADRHPEKAYLQDQTGEALRDTVIKHLSDALNVCRRAAIYAERVEWLTSGDDGDSSFCVRLEKELAECDRTGGVV